MTTKLFSRTQLSKLETFKFREKTAAVCNQ